MVLLQPTLELARAHGARQPALCVRQLTAATDLPPDAPTWIVYETAEESAVSSVRSSGRRLAPVTGIPDDIDALIVLETDAYAPLMRTIERSSRRDRMVIPASPDALVPQRLRSSGAMEAAWETTAAANYVARCALRGHYLEFGTWYGRSFIGNYYRFRHWLQGRFYAFDSFDGLSSPLTLETAYTGGDFAEGAYWCNERSFKANLDLAGVARERVRVVAGFYGDTLVCDPAEYDLQPESVSVCVVDCDLREPTEQVLRFVTPLLEPGALIYFDDWRLTRASSVVGERAAALQWLDANPDVELIEFERDFWQHQWFIFQRRR